MDNKETITTLNAIKFMLDNDQYSDDVELALDTAIAALEKQIPKRKLGKDQYNENLFTIRCPTCGELIGNYNKRLDRFSYMVKKNYCYICGQAIDFSKPQQEEQDG
jgi:hypothetical protein